MTNLNETVLVVTASARKNDSTTRALAKKLISRLYQQRGVPNIIVRDVANGLPLIDENWVAANFTDPTERNEDQQSVLAFSDKLVAEVKAADVIIIAAPIYNFSIPASLKAWIDLIARARETFRYTENGPIGLLEGKKAYLVMASGGTPIGSDVDFATDYLKHVLGFVGVHDVKIVSASQQMGDPDAVTIAERNIEEIAISQFQ